MNKNKLFMTQINRFNKEFETHWWLYLAARIVLSNLIISMKVKLFSVGFIYGV